MHQLWTIIVNVYQQPYFRCIMYLTDQECFTDTLKRNTDDNKESTLSKQVLFSFTFNHNLLSEYLKDRAMFMSIF